MTIIQCLGGWCQSRNRCAHYHADPLHGRAPIERLCGDTEEPEPITRIGRLPVDKSSCAQPEEKTC